MCSDWCRSDDVDCGFWCHDQCDTRIETAYSMVCCDVDEACREYVVGCWRLGGVAVSRAIRFASVAGGGRITPATPTLSYAGSGTTDNGKFTITNYDASYTYTVSGGTLSGSTLTVTSATGSATISAITPKGLSSSASRTAYRHAADQTSVAFTQCYNPCGNCRTDVNPHTWSCGCGSGCNDAGGGQWGDCICRGPGYSYWNNYGTSGYTWSGSNYTNGSGEWWKIV